MKIGIDANKLANFDTMQPTQYYMLNAALTMWMFTRGVMSTMRRKMA